MATKTISIDMAAYERLTSARRGNESFSRVIRRLVPAPLDVDAFLAGLDAAPIGDAAVKAVERHERARHAPSARKR